MEALIPTVVTKSAQPVPMGNAEFPKIILGKMHEALKPHGFRKKGSSFATEPADVLQLVQFRKSWTSSNDEVNGFVLVGVHSRFLQGKGIGPWRLQQM